MSIMKIIKLEKGKINKQDLGIAVQVLRAGGVVMHPTETCYGLAVDIFNEGALKRLYALKGRDFNKPVSMMVRDLEDAKKYVEFNEVALQLAKKFWPGPLTLVLPRKKSLPEFFNSGMNLGAQKVGGQAFVAQTVGVRCPDSAVSQALIKAYGGPLSTTSANVSGCAEVYKLEDYLAQLRDSGVGVGLDVGAVGGGNSKLRSRGGRLDTAIIDFGFDDLGPDLILDGGELPKNLPSTLVGFDASGKVGEVQLKILREGAMLREVKSFLKIV